MRAPQISSVRTKKHLALTRNRYSGADLSTAITPECGPDDVLIAPRFVGLCGTDVQVYRRGQEAVANILGHEGVGIVVEVGRAVTSWKQGDAVVFNPVNPVDPDEVLGLSYDGLFQERVLIQNAESVSWLIHRISHRMLKPIGTLIVPVATAIYSARLASTVAGSLGMRRAVVVGDGPIALINSIVLRLSGYRSVQMIHGSSSRYRWAVGNGYFEPSNVIPRTGLVAESVKRNFGGMESEAVIVCVPAEATEQSANDALGYLKPGGLINFVSSSFPPVISLSGGDVNLSELQRRNSSGLPSAGAFEEFVSSAGKLVNISGQRGVSSSDLHAGIELLTGNSQLFKSLITDVVAMDKAVSAIGNSIDWALGRGDGVRSMKTVIELNKDVF